VPPKSREKKLGFFGRDGFAPFGGKSGFLGGFIAVAVWMEGLANKMKSNDMIETMTKEEEREYVRLLNQKENHKTLNLLLYGVD